MIVKQGGGFAKCAHPGERGWRGSLSLCTQRQCCSPASVVSCSGAANLKRKQSVAALSARACLCSTTASCGGLLKGLHRELAACTALHSLAGGWLRTRSPSDLQQPCTATSSLLWCRQLFRSLLLLASFGQMMSLSAGWMQADCWCDSTLGILGKHCHWVACILCGCKAHWHGTIQIQPNNSAELSIVTFSEN